MNIFCTTIFILHTINLVTALTGMDIAIEDAPYHVSIIYKYYDSPKTIGNGAIISNKHIFTSYRGCGPPAYPDKQLVRVGSVMKDSEGILYNVTKIFYRVDNFRPIIILLQEELVFSPSVQPIALPEPSNETLPFETVGIVTGFTDATKHLQKVGIDVKSRDLCNEYYQNVSYYNYCGGRDQVGAAFFDYGAPFVVDNVLKGSFEIRFAGHSEREPALYLQVSPFREWIKEVTGV